MINRSDIRKQLEEGLNAVFGLEYDSWPEEWRDIFTVYNSNKAYEEDVQMVGLGAAAVKAEGEHITYDEGYEGYTARYHNKTIALAFAITEEAIEDGLYGDTGSKMSASLAESFQYTKEVEGANVLNNGFDTNYAGGDGVPLFSTAHPLAGGGTLSNKLATPAEVAESSLEELAIQIGDWTDDRGIPKKFAIQRIIIPNELQFVLTRILGSEHQPDTEGNNINALKKLGTYKAFSVNHYLTDPEQWYVITNAKHGLKHFKRVGMKRGMEGDFNTGNLRFKGRERYAFGWSNWRGAAASGDV